MSTTGGGISFKNVVKRLNLLKLLARVGKDNNMVERTKGNNLIELPLFSNAEYVPSVYTETVGANL